MEMNNIILFNAIAQGTGKYIPILFPAPSLFLHTLRRAPRNPIILPTLVNALFPVEVYLPTTQ